MLLTKILSQTGLRATQGYCTASRCRSWKFIHITDINHHLIQEVFYGVHIWSFVWPIHNFYISVFQEIWSCLGCGGTALDGEVNHDVSHMSYLINLELSKISYWLAVNKLSLNVDKTKFMIFHNHQKVIPTHEIPCLVINWKRYGVQIIWTNNKWIYELEFPFIKYYKQIYRALGIMHRLKRYMPLSAMKMIYVYI